MFGAAVVLMAVGRHVRARWCVVRCRALVGSVGDMAFTHVVTLRTVVRVIFSGVVIFVYPFPPENRNHRPVVGGVSTGEITGAPSREGYLVSGQMAKASNK